MKEDINQILTGKDEVALLLRLRKGDEAAFNSLYHSYRSMLYHSIYNMVRLEEESADLLQELFTKVWQKRREIDPSLPFKSFIFRIAQNIVYDFFRQISRKKNLEDQLVAIAANNADYTPVDDSINDKETAAMLEQALLQLPPQCREVFTLCKIEGKSYEEVSRQLSISKATVNNHITKANKLIKEFLEQQDHLPFLLVLLGLLVQFR